MQSRLRALGRAGLSALQRGVEREGLRVTCDGVLATSPHPPSLGAALTHPHITTDFSESQLELVTGVHTTALSCVNELSDLHQFVYRNIGDELLWCASMPCDLPDEQGIPIAQFGVSNEGRAKSVYRTGLAHRYGRRMQLISGLHYNFSLAEHIWPFADFANPDDGYFALIRNFRRHAWLLLYLFGASPAVAESFVEGRSHNLQRLASDTLYLPFATSLRMGRFGYLSEAQDRLAVSYNDLRSYAASLEEALTTPYPPYERIGVREGDDYRQLGTSLLQIENEFYSTIRPKRVVRPGERPLRALRERGVQYVEVRAMDLDPFSPIGITAATIRFLDIFLLHCLLSDSPLDTPDEIAAIGRNKQRVAAHGREPGVRLDRPGGSVSLSAWARQIVSDCEPIAAVLDEAAEHGSDHRDALASAAEMVDSPQCLPSARVLQMITERHAGSFLAFALEQSRQHRASLLERSLPADVIARFDSMAEASLHAQRAIEAGDRLPFEVYRQRYLSSSAVRAIDERSGDGS